MRSAAAQVIFALDPIESRGYDGIDHDRLIAYVVNLLDHREIRATFENVTAAAFRLFPDVFSLAGFPEYPDAARVNRTLLHGGPKYRDYLTGKATTGYSLSTRGLTAASETEEMIEGAGGGLRHRGRAKAARTFSERMEREVRNSDAFRAWKLQAELPTEDFYLFLHLLPGSPREAVRENLHAMKDHLQDSADAEIAAFLAYITTHFKKEL